MRRAIIALVLILGCDTSTGPDCRIGKLCGNTCIASDKVCHVDDPPPDLPGNPSLERAK